MKKILGFIGLFFLAGTVFPLASKEMSDRSFPTPPENLIQEEGVQQAVFAGGCFWGVEEVFQRLEGVQDVLSGYTGGAEDTASYYVVSKGTTGHAESVLIRYDSDVISYGTLLEIFFAVAHDPTQLNYQGPDHGTQYRSAVFFSTPSQKKAVEEYIRLLEQTGVYKDRIVTEVTPLDQFYPAESYHQDFMQKNPGHPYIVHWDNPKVKHLEEGYGEFMKK